MKIIIDRFEGSVAVVELEDGSMIDVSRKLFPSNAKEGSVLNIVVDETATDEKLQKNIERMNKLFKD